MSAASQALLVWSEQELQVQRASANQALVQALYGVPAECKLAYACSST